uniref:VWFA domain-containing protein n=1 Tax=Caenorhabditis japonica TaxID=281687 RepID=A0A8R1I6W7_CAEJA
MPPWKMPGVDISHFRTARPHQAPGTSPPTTTPSAPTNSLPMPPGTSQIMTIGSEVLRSEPHPPAPPPQVEGSGMPAKVETMIDNGSTELINSTSTSQLSSEEIMTVTASDGPEAGVVKILSPVFEDITKVDNATDSDDVLRFNLLSDKNESLVEGSGANDLELISPLETTTVIMTTSEKSLSEARTMATESSSVPTTESSSKPVIETTLASSNKLSTNTPKKNYNKSSALTIPNNGTRDMKTMNIERELPEESLNATLDCKSILFLLDSSGNVIQQYEKQKKYIEEIVNQLEAKHHRKMSLITFAGRTRQKIVVPLPEEPNGKKFTEKLKKARFLRGVTATGAAISVTTQYVLQKTRNVQVVIVTDGFSFDDVEQQSEALRTVVENEVYVTGRYFPVVRNVLLSIGGTDNNVFFDKKEHRLIDALQC